MSPIDIGFCDDGDEFERLDNTSKKKEREKEERLVYGSPFHTQVAVLFVRSWRTIWREKVCLDYIHRN